MVEVAAFPAFDSPDPGALIVRADGALERWARGQMDAATIQQCVGELQRLRMMFDEITTVRGTDGHDSLSEIP